MTGSPEIGIAAIAGYCPDTTISNLDRLDQYDVSEEFIRNKTGFTHVARKAPSQEASDLAVRAIDNLQQQASLDLNELDCLVVVTQNPDGFGLPHTSAILHGRLGLPQKCSVFDVSLGCSGWVHGLSIVGAYMTANGFSKGMLVTSDPYSRVIREDAKDVALLFGDGATATLLTDTPRWRLGRFDIGACGESNQALAIDKDRILHMNGRAVFNFSAIHVPQSVDRTLRANELSRDDIDRFIFHQGSKYILDTVANRLRVAERSRFCAAAYGNTVSSSVPMAFLDSVQPADKTVLVCGFGVGLSWATTVLRRAD